MRQQGQWGHHCGRVAGCINWLGLGLGRSWARFWLVCAWDGRFIEYDLEAHLGGGKAAEAAGLPLLFLSSSSPLRCPDPLPWQESRLSQVLRF